MDRRRLLQALGFGAASALLDQNRTALADATAPPSRIVFYIQPHGHIPAAWKMAIPGAPPANQYAEMSLAALQKPTDLCEPLQSLFAFRDRLLVIEGLAHTASLADIAA